MRLVLAGTLVVTSALVLAYPKIPARRLATLAVEPGSDLRLLRTVRMTVLGFVVAGGHGLVRQSLRLGGVPSPLRPGNCADGKCDGRELEPEPDPRIGRDLLRREHERIEPNACHLNAYEDLERQADNEEEPSQELP